MRLCDYRSYQDQDPPPIRYAIGVGDKLQFRGGTYVMAHVAVRNVALISIKTGSRWSDMIPVRYAIGVGDKLQFRGGTYVMAHVAGGCVALVNIMTGSSWTNMVSVACISSLSKGEVAMLLDGVPFYEVEVLEK